ncbi:homoserine dehydrogenase [Acrocarpospora pleiomorpha]|uniref:Homoserine dehydrogenase n=1 Tax=Acrocarpospora pleiomorpha TaxID=90975 RepID=A0A5M3XFZ1_9ACTN|nr:homoserine dehydrogenase [Acrocarpospora pleiomorpha]GES18511.1 homoserine dehydrogenase [Acrocarpospora pleiomorpha]
MREVSQVGDASNRPPHQVGVVLSGYGPVGQAFVRYLAQQANALARRHGVRLGVGAVRAGSAQCWLPEGGPVPPRSDWSPPASLEETLDRTAARVLVQAIPSSPHLRQHAAEEAIAALRRGVHVVTATKSHLLSHWRVLDEAARASGSMIRISGATGAALPAGDIARTALRGVGCDTIRACPNGTVTFVLDRLAEGDSLPDAVREAQRRGIAEADPSSDLSGVDAATKVRLLAALAWGWDPASVRVQAQPVHEGTASDALRAVSRSRRLRAVASARVDEPLLVHVRLEETEPGDPLHALTGPEKAVVFGCPDAGDIIVSGGRSSPLGAALALVKDTIEVTAPRYGFF